MRTDDEWIRVSIWDSPPTLWMSKLNWNPDRIKKALQERLHEVGMYLDENNSIITVRMPGKQSLDPSENSLSTFVKDAGQVLLCLLDTLNACSTLNNPKKRTLQATQTTSTCWSIENIMTLYQQLEDLEYDYVDKNPILELSENLSSLTLQYADAANRHHTAILNLSNFPQTISLGRWDVPIDSTITNDDVGDTDRDWKPTNTPTEPLHDMPSTSAVDTPIRNVYQSFVETINKYQDFWNELDDIDANTWVLEPSTHRSIGHRHIYLNPCCKLILHVHPQQPRRLSKVRFVGSQAHSYEGMYQAYSWDATRSVRENLEQCVGRSLAKNPENGLDTNEEGTFTSLRAIWDCGICFCATTPTTNQQEDEQVSICENPKCARPYHASCLERWLSSLPTTRMSFDILIGTCPYCKDPIAVPRSASWGS